jgi:beta-glucosidase
VDVALDRPAILTPINDVVTGLTVTFGVSDDAWLAALTGQVRPEGRLPVELPRSMRAVKDSAPDAAAGTADPLFPLGSGLVI